MKKIAFFLLGSLMPLVATADQILPNKNSQDYGICDLLALVNSTVSIVVKGIIPLIATAIIAWAGFRMITNQGNSDIAKQSKMIFWAVAIGLIIMFASYAIVGTILVGMGYTTNAFDWAPKCTQ